MPSFMNTIGNISLFIEDFQGLEELGSDNTTVIIGYRECVYTVELVHLESSRIYYMESGAFSTSERFGVTVGGVTAEGGKYWRSFLFESESPSLPAVLEIVEKRLRELLTDWHLEPADYYK